MQKTGSYSTRRVSSFHSNSCNTAASFTMLQEGLFPPAFRRKTTLEKLLEYRIFIVFNFRPVLTLTPPLVL
jgi:hypothetical protein